MYRLISGCLFCFGLLLGSVRAQVNMPGLPTVDVQWHQNTTFPAYLFLTTERFVLPTNKPSTLMIRDRFGDLAWYFAGLENMYDFRPQPNGLLTFNVSDEWYVFDSTFNLTSLPTCGGASTDMHDLLLLPDGRSFELCNEDTLMDLSSLTTNTGQQGDTIGNVRYCLIVERDANGAVVRTWRGIDHFDLADMQNVWFNFPTHMDLNHTNSIAYNGQHMLLSHRNNNEVTLIKWATGQILWRLGGANNQFLFPNGNPFYSQHDAQFAGAGRISLFDNGTYNAPPKPRGLVYQLDTIAMTATLVTEWEDNASESHSMGSFRLHANGDGLVCWGQVYPENRPNISYFKADGQKACDLQFEDEHVTYRAVFGELPFPIHRPAILCERQNGNLVLHTDSTYASYAWSNGASTPLIAVADTGFYQLFVPRGIGFAGSAVMHITDLNAACPILDAPAPITTQPREPKWIGTVDLMGRPVTKRQQGQIYIERYDNGQSRRVVSF